MPDDVVRLARDAPPFGGRGLDRRELGARPARLVPSQDLLGAGALADLDGEQERGEDRHRNEELGIDEPAFRTRAP